MSISADTLTALATARLSTKWLVLICPDDDSLLESRRVLSSGLGKNDKFSGRTAFLEEGGRISIVNVCEEPFDSDMNPYSVFFLGLWKTPGMEMIRWRTAASEVLTLSM